MYAVAVCTSSSLSSRSHTRTSPIPAEQESGVSLAWDSERVRAPRAQESEHRQMRTTVESAIVIRRADELR
eukprot:1294129-Prymnesium_polylepis.1